MFIYSQVSGKIDVSGNLVEIHATDKKSDGYKYIIDNLNKDYDCLVCAGGDGALSEAVSALINKNMDMPLGYIPSGSNNDFAKSIGIPYKMKEAAQAIVSGKRQSFDVRKFDERCFVYLAAFGLFTEVSYKTDQDLKNVMEHAPILFLASGILI